MKTITLTSAVTAALVIIPSLASAEGMHRYPSPNATSRSYTAQTNVHRGSFGGPDPYGVYIGGHKIGRDPDPNVRQQLVSDYLYEHRW